MAHSPMLTPFVVENHSFQQQHDAGGISPGDRLIFETCAQKGKLSQAELLVSPEAFRILSAERQAALTKPPEVEAPAKKPSSQKKKPAQKKPPCETPPLAEALPSATEALAFVNQLLAEPLPRLINRLQVDARHPKLAALANSVSGDQKKSLEVQQLLALACAALATRHDGAPTQLAETFLKLKDTVRDEAKTRRMFSRFFMLIRSGKLHAENSPHEIRNGDFSAQ